jgi:hypothetical protein
VRWARACAPGCPRPELLDWDSRTIPSVLFAGLLTCGNGRGHLSQTCWDARVWPGPANLVLDGNCAEGGCLLLTVMSKRLGYATWVRGTMHRINWTESSLAIAWRASPRRLSPSDVMLRGDYVTADGGPT